MPPTRLSRKKRATTTRRILFLNEFSSLHKTWRLTMGLCNNCRLAVKTALGHQRIVPWYKPIVKSSCSLLILILHKWKVMVSSCSKAIARRQSTPHASTHRSILGFVCYFPLPFAIKYLITVPSRSLFARLFSFGPLYKKQMTSTDRPIASIPF